MKTLFPSGKSPSLESESHKEFEIEICMENWSKARQIRLQSVPLTEISNFSSDAICQRDAMLFIATYYCISSGCFLASIRYTAINDKS